MIKIMIYNVFREFVTYHTIIYYQKQFMTIGASGVGQKKCKSSDGSSSKKNIKKQSSDGFLLKV